MWQYICHYSFCTTGWSLTAAYGAVRSCRAAGGCDGSVAFASGSSAWAAESQSHCLLLPHPPPADAAGCTSSARWLLSGTPRCWSERFPEKRKKKSKPVLRADRFCYLLYIKCQLQHDELSIKCLFNWAPFQGQHSCQSPALTGSWWGSGLLMASWTNHLVSCCTGTHLKQKEQKRTRKQNAIKPEDKNTLQRKMLPCPHVKICASAVVNSSYCVSMLGFVWVYAFYCYPRVQ